MNYAKKLKKELTAKFIKSPILVLEILRDDVFLDEEDENHKTTLLNIAAFNEVKSDNAKLIFLPKHDTQLAQIRSNTYDLIKTITSQQAKNYYKKENVLTDILILCRVETRDEEMRKLFPIEIYPNTVIVPEEKLKEIDCKKYSLIIYDNFPLEHYMPGLEGGLEDIVKNTDKYVLFYSPENLPELHTDYSDRVYFANSQFSIHSRIDEMLLFLRRFDLD